MNTKCHAALFLLLCIIPPLYSQEEIISFDNNWTIDLSANYHYLQFDQENLFGCRGNKPLDIGIGVRYKKIALGFNIELPYSAEFFHPNSESFDLNLDYFGNSFVIDTYFSRYHSFFINNHQLEDLFDNTDVDLDILMTGMFACWVPKHKIHTLRGVYKLDEKQTVSNGSPIFGFGFYYHSVFSGDDKLPGYDTKQYFIYTGPLGGFSYTWVMGKGAFLNFNFIAGINSGLNTNKMKAVYIPAFFPGLIIGYHFKTWSLVSSVDAKIFLIIQSYEIETADWYNLCKMNITLLKITKRF